MAERGHEVVLFEATNALGGQVRLAVQASWRRDLIGLVDWRAAELERLGVRLQFNHYAERGDVEAEQPDVVLIATGGVPDFGWIPGGEHCTSAWDILSGNVNPGESVLVYDGTGRHCALTAADYISAAGREVSLVALDGQLSMEMAASEQVIWRRRAYEIDLDVALDHRLERVVREGNRLSVTFVNELTGEPDVRRTDQLVVECGTLPVTDTFDALEPASANRGFTDLEALLGGQPQPRRAIGAGAGAFELYRFGDAVSSRNIHAAVLDALRLCRVL